MAYRFGAGQPVSHEIRRVLSEEVDSAINQLTKHSSKDRDKDVHEARKSVKKTRGLLRLIAPLIGEKNFRKENAQLRDIGRVLSQLRDARAIIESFDAIVKETAERKLLPPDLVEAVRGRLLAHKSETEQKVNVAETLASAATALGTVREHAESYQLGETGFEGLERGLKNTYRRGRKAMKQAKAAQDADDFHNWRKRVKDHWYHVRLLGDLKTEFLKTREDDLGNLETWLGDDHNIAVLRDAVNADRAGFGHPKQVRQFLAVAKQHGQELRGKALALGEQLYALKPKQLISELAEARNIWPFPAAPSADDGNQDASSNKIQPLRTANGHGAAAAKQLRKKAASAPSRRPRTRAQA